MNKKLAFKFNFLFIILVLFVAGSFIFTGAVFNNNTLQAVENSVSYNEGEDSDGADSGDTSIEATAVSGKDSIADLGGWTESDPIVTPKEFTKTVGGYVFYIKLGTDDDAEKYQLFMYDIFEEIQLTANFATDYGLIYGLIIDEFERRILFSDNDSLFSFQRKESLDAQMTIVYKTNYNDSNFTLTLAIEVDDNFGKINLSVFDENNDNEVYLLGSENGTFVDATRTGIDLAVMLRTIDERREKIFEEYEKINSTVSFLAPVVNSNIPSLVASIIGSSIGIGVIVGVCYYFIRSKKPLVATSSTNKNKSKRKSKNKKK